MQCHQQIDDYSPFAGSTDKPTNFKQLVLRTALTPMAEVCR
jgi:hypothetical protein